MFVRENLHENLHDFFDVLCFGFFLFFLCIKMCNEIDDWLTDWLNLSISQLSILQN